MEWQAKELKKLIGMTDNDYINYTSRKLLIKSNVKGGTGHNVKYTEDDVLRNYIAIQLFKCGVSQPVAKEHAINAGFDGKKAFIVTGPVIITVNLKKMQKRLIREIQNEK